jgi:hypothetical protein
MSGSASVEEEGVITTERGAFLDALMAETELRLTESRGRELVLQSTDAHGP